MRGRQQLRRPAIRIRPATSEAGQRRGAGIEITDDDAHLIAEWRQLQRAYAELAVGPGPEPAGPRNAGGAGNTAPGTICAGDLPRADLDLPGPVAPGQVHFSHGSVEGSRASAGGTDTREEDTYATQPVSNGMPGRTGEPEGSAQQRPPRPVRRKRGRLVGTPTDSDDC